ncbi:CAAX prenyl protease-like protein [Collimonas sp. PA-H2]|uniref:CPBP family intramembrane glutamic endopeptidase n=1 Tax=Collimonas sp. PA-H2 TaxID=1881062 RepID=UPI000BF8D0E3|nr:CPBP family intramembrane glutamic endopeptidase [Collimonas sp. PA-H2]PFH10237.1 CAAX prenyl protease-like protein [Collimonas sp. PA-H2]
MSILESRRAAVSMAGVLLVLIAASLPYAKWVDEFQSVTHLIFHELIWWGIVFLVLAYVHFVEKRPLASIGLRAPKWTDLPTAVVFGIVTLAGLIAIINIGLPALGLQLNGENVSQISNTPFWWRVISVVRAAASEEMLFRGYAIERIQELTKSKMAAAIITCIVFTLAHVGPWGWSHILVAGFGGIAFTLLYLWKRNLCLNVIAHFMVDAAAFL